MKESRISRNHALELREIGRSSAARNESKSVLVEGFRAIAGAKSSGAKFRYVMSVESDDERLQTLGCEVISIDEKTAKTIATTPNPQGALAICEMPVANLNSFAQNPIIEKPVFVLDEVSDPGNVGTIIRSATAFGIGGILMVGGCDPFHPKVVRSSAGMIFGCPISTIEPFQLESTLSGREIYTAQVSENSDMESISFPKNPAIAFGNEANGFQTPFFKDNTLNVSINMEELCESLNVAMTATIVAYHLSTLKN